VAGTRDDGEVGPGSGGDARGLDLGEHAAAPEARAEVASAAPATAARLRTVGMRRAEGSRRGLAV
jgi:hypothetical protein